MNFIRKARKLARNPKRFWEDSSLNLNAKQLPKSKKTIAFAFKINHWKREFIEKNYPEYEWYFVPFKKTVDELDNKIKSVHDKVFYNLGV